MSGTNILHRQYHNQLITSQKNISTETITRHSKPQKQRNATRQRSNQLASAGKSIPQLFILNYQLFIDLELLSLKPDFQFALKAARIENAEAVDAGPDED